MKPVNKNVADSFHRESVSGVDAVFKRMLKVVGDYGDGYAKSFDVSENTIKTWRRRGAVSLRYLEGFARAYNVSLDQLLYGEEVTAEPPQFTLTPDEQILIDGYRALDAATRKRLLAFVLGGEVAVPAGNKKRIKVSATGGNAAGRDVVNSIKGKT